MFSWKFFCFVALFISIVGTREQSFRIGSVIFAMKEPFFEKIKNFYDGKFNFSIFSNGLAAVFFSFWCRCEHISYKNGFSCHFVRRWCFKTKIEVTSSSFHNSWIKHKRNHWLCQMQYFCTMYANKLRAKKKLRRDIHLCVYGESITLYLSIRDRLLTDQLFDGKDV